LNDDPVQSTSARSLLSSFDIDNRGYVGISVLLETFWLLRSRYKVPRETLHDTIRQLLMTDHIEFESFEAIARALTLYQKGAEFPDALVAERNLEAGCRFTHTLNQRAAARIPSMELLA
jgi:predicted nucleic-acid-binding protein